MSNAKPCYEVVWPLGKVAFDELPARKQTADLSGKTVAFLWDHAFYGDVMFAVVQEEFAKRFSGVKFVPHQVFGDVHGLNEREIVAAIPEKLLQNKVDLAISGIGA